VTNQRRATVGITEEVDVAVAEEVEAEVDVVVVEETTAIITMIQATATLNQPPTLQDEGLKTLVAAEVLYHHQEEGEEEGGQVHDTWAMNDLVLIGYVPSYPQMTMTKKKRWMKIISILLLEQ
jgi:hypothetical protein